MFSRKEVGVLGWLILLLILNVPILNVVFVVWALLSNKVNKTLKNFFTLYIFLWALQFFGIFSVTFSSLQGLFG